MTKKENKSMKTETTQKKFVRIQSSIDITVTAGLQSIDMTNYNSDIPDRMKVSAAWPLTTCDIRSGSGLYPAYIAQWNTVKNLQKDGILTIGEYTDNAESEEQVEIKKELDKNLAAVETRLKQQKSIKSINLSDIAGE